jgi:transposase
MEAAMGQMLAIRTDVDSPAGLRRRAKKEPNRRAALRMLAIANALEGMSRADAARVVGIERQSLCDAIKRFNAEGLAGLYDHPNGHRRPALSEGEDAALIARILRGPIRRKASLPVGPCRIFATLLRSGLASTWARNPCRGWCAGSGCRGRRPGPFIPSATPRRLKPSKKGASVGRKSRRCRPSSMPLSL